jgi:enoyl-CoA hydratase/carnithine racemase
MPEIKTDIREDGVAIVTIHHPEKRNACTQGMWEALGEVFTGLPKKSKSPCHNINW